jgi:hypothetical protein
MPLIASEGIQEMEVTHLSIRMIVPFSRSNPSGRGYGAADL